MGRGRGLGGGVGNKGCGGILGDEAAVGDVGGGVLLAVCGGGWVGGQQRMWVGGKSSKLQRHAITQMVSLGYGLGTWLRVVCKGGPRERRGV